PFSSGVNSPSVHRRARYSIFACKSASARKLAMASAVFTPKVLPTGSSSRSSACEVVILELYLVKRERTIAKKMRKLIPAFLRDVDSQHQIDHPAAADVRARSAAMAQDVRVAAT